MGAENSNYTVGRGKPPLHTRFQKGRSGNPSGKPGPAKLARQRFQRALYAALDGETAELKHSLPRGTLEFLARRFALDAMSGRIGSMKLILSELDREIVREEPDPRFARSETGGQPPVGGSPTEATDEEPIPDYALWRKAHPDD